LGLSYLGGNNCLFFGVDDVGLDLLGVLVDRAELDGIGCFGLLRILETGGRLHFFGIDTFDRFEIGSFKEFLKNCTKLTAQ
jgi:hypothetical protein